VEGQIERKRKREREKERRWVRERERERKKRESEWEREREEHYSKMCERRKIEYTKDDAANCITANQVNSGSRHTKLLCFLHQQSVYHANMYFIKTFLQGRYSQKLEGYIKIGEDIYAANMVAIT
jgi:hypothetical protein